MTCLVELFVSVLVPAPATAAPTSHLLLSSLKLAAGDEFDELLDPAEHAPLTAANDDEEVEDADGDQ